MRSAPFDMALSAAAPRAGKFLVLGFMDGQMVAEDHTGVARGSRTIQVGFPRIGPVAARGTQPSVSRDAAASPDAEVCSTHFDRSLGHPWATLAGTYATTYGGTQQFVYTQSATTAAGVGASPSGSAGSFSADGSEKVSTSVGGSFAPVDDSAGSHHWYTELTENEYYTRCYQTLTGQTYTTYYTSNDGVYGGSRVTQVGTISAPDCAPYTAGYTYKLYKTTASTFGAGITLPFINFNASARTGYTTTAEVKLQLNIARDICGENAGPGHVGPGPGQVEVKP